MMNLRSPQRCLHGAAASPGHLSNLCRSKLLLQISPSSDWLPCSQCTHPLFPTRAPFGLLQPLSPPSPFQWDKRPSNQSYHHPTKQPPTLSATGRKTQSFIHLFPPSFLCSLFILVNFTSPLGMLRGSYRCRAHKSKQSTFCHFQHHLGFL